MSDAEYLLVGLGNPGTQYQNTRHNAGSMLVDALAKSWGCNRKIEKHKSILRQVQVAGKNIVLLQPLTYMNLSGTAVVHYVNFHKLPAHQLIVVHDDIDMAPGRVKLVLGGGAGGHNGIKSINSSLGITDYYRLKIGVGRPGKDGVHSDISVEAYVLSPFFADQQAILAERFEAIERGLKVFFEESPAAAATILNSLK